MSFLHLFPRAYRGGGLEPPPQKKKKKFLGTPLLVPLSELRQLTALLYPKPDVVCQVTRLEKPFYFPLLLRVNCPCCNSVMVSFLGESGHVINADWFSGLRKHFRLLHSIRQIQVIREMDLFPPDQARFCVSFVLCHGQ